MTRALPVAARARGGVEPAVGGRAVLATQVDAAIARNAEQQHGRILGEVEPIGPREQPRENVLDDLLGVVRVAELVGAEARQALAPGSEDRLDHDAVLTSGGAGCSGKPVR
jgi:hypothetical protein